MKCFTGKNLKSFSKSNFFLPSRALFQSNKNRNDQRMEKNKKPPRSGDEKPKEASFVSNLQWMRERKNEISLNPGYTELNTSEFGSAMSKAEQAEADSVYYR